MWPTPKPQKQTVRNTHATHSTHPDLSLILRLISLFQTIMTKKTGPLILSFRPPNTTLPPAMALALYNTLHQLGIADGDALTYAQTFEKQGMFSFHQTMQLFLWSQLYMICSLHDRCLCSRLGPAGARRAQGAWCFQEKTKHVTIVMQ
jgi:hypothetical protein